MLVYLSFLVCLHGSVCHTTIPIERPFVGLSACEVGGMQIAPSWEEAHPGLKVTKINCTMGKKPVDQEGA